MSAKDAAAITPREASLARPVTCTGGEARGQPCAPQRADAGRRRKRGPPRSAKAAGRCRSSGTV